MICRKSSWHSAKAGAHCLLPPEHPVSRRLAEAGLALKKEFFRFEGLAAPGGGGLYGK